VLAKQSGSIAASRTDDTFETGRGDAALFLNWCSGPATRRSRALASGSTRGRRPSSGAHRALGASLTRTPHDTGPLHRGIYRPYDGEVAWTDD
jgi:hypothetical protein